MTRKIKTENESNMRSQIILGTVTLATGTGSWSVDMAWGNIRSASAFVQGKSNKNILF